MTKGLALLLSFLLFIATSCMGSSDLEVFAEENINTVRVAGSTTVSPLIKELRTAYEIDHPGSRIEVQEIGTSAGISATIEGVSHIAMASRYFSEEELNQGLVGMPFALDGIAVIVHPDNNIDNLTLEEVTKIFKGEIYNWSQVGGADAEIIVVSREEGSGIRSSFEELANLEVDIERNGRMYKDSEIAKNAIYEKGTGAVKGTIRANENAIGYITTGVLDDTVNAIKIDGVGFSEESVRNGDYPFVNTFLIATKEETPSNVQAFIDFIFSEEGQALISQKGYVSIG